MQLPAAVPQMPVNMREDQARGMQSQSPPLIPSQSKGETKEEERPSKKKPAVPVLNLDSIKN